MFQAIDPDRYWIILILLLFFYWQKKGSNIVEHYHNIMGPTDCGQVSQTLFMFGE